MVSMTRFDDVPPPPTSFKAESRFTTARKDMWESATTTKLAQVTVGLLVFIAVVQVILLGVCSAALARLLKFY